MRWNAYKLHKQDHNVLHYSHHNRLASLSVTTPHEYLVHLNDLWLLQSPVGNQLGLVALGMANRVIWRNHGLFEYVRILALHVHDTTSEYHVLMSIQLRQRSPITCILQSVYAHHYEYVARFPWFHLTHQRSYRFQWFQIPSHDVWHVVVLVSDKAGIGYLTIYERFYLAEWHRLHRQNKQPPDYRSNVLWNASPQDRTHNLWLYLHVTVLNRRPYTDGQHADWENTIHLTMLLATLAKQSVGNKPMYHVLQLLHLKVSLNGHNGSRLQLPRQHGNHHLSVSLRIRHRQSHVHLHHQWWLMANRVNQHDLCDPVQTVL